MPSEETCIEVKKGREKFSPVEMCWSITGWVEEVKRCWCPCAWRFQERPLINRAFPESASVSCALGFSSCMGWGMMAEPSFRGSVYFSLLRQVFRPLPGAFVRVLSRHHLVPAPLSSACSVLFGVRWKARIKREYTNSLLALIGSWHIDWVTFPT